MSKNKAKQLKKNLNTLYKSTMPISDDSMKQAMIEATWDEVFLLVEELQNIKPKGDSK